MVRATRFAVGLALGLALLTWVALVIAKNTARRWFENDISLRVQLAVAGARQALVTHFRDERAGARAGLESLLNEIAHDERIMAAAACSPEAVQLASTAWFPAEVSCKQAAGHVRPGPGAPASEWRRWKTVTTLPGGRVHIDAQPILDGQQALGFVLLIHDLSYAEGREATTQRFLLISFGLLAIAASVVTILAVRLSRRGWRDELRRSLQGEEQMPEFQPILQDVRELIERIVAEREAEKQEGGWSPQRLKQTLSRYLHGEKILIVANREPYIHERNPDGSLMVLHPASGLVTALEPVMRACGGVWLAHGSGSADRETADAHGRIKVPPGEDSYLLRRIWLSEEEENGYYYGFSNEGLWPLCHVAHTRPVFRSQDWQQYVAINQRFSDAVCAEADTDDPIVLVQDYHFALAPRMIREKLPRATVIMFWHIPWPNVERFGICPFRDQILEGLLGSSILGFQIQSHCNNFFDAVDRFLEARLDREQHAVVQHGHSTLVRPYPISIEWPVQWLSSLPSVAECRAAIRSELGLRPDAILGIGVDRLDYTKGIEERLLAVERLLERAPELRGRFTFIQIGAPSRTKVERYRQLNESVAVLADRINERFGSDSYRPIALLRSHHEPRNIFRYYRAAELCYVSSLHDGMNLVAKEFAAAREDEQGVLMLSQFTGAARELTEALIVNPYDLDEASAAMLTAVQMSPLEQRERMRSMRAFVAEFNVYRWAGRMLVDAARVRRRGRLTGRLSDHHEGNGSGRRSWKQPWTRSDGR